MANNYVLGKGKLYFDPWDTNNATTGERYLGNCPGFDITINSTSLEHFSSESGIKQKDDEVLLEVTRNATITCDNITEDNMALFVIGNKSAPAQSSGAVVDEVLTVKKDRYYQLGAVGTNYSGVRNVSSVTVTDNAGTTTYTAGADYTLDTTMARIYIVSTGAITDGQVIKVDYTKAAVSRNQVASASLTATTGALRFVADNPKGTNRDLYAPKANLKPNGSFKWIGDAWLEVAFTAEFLQKDTTVPALLIDGRAA